MKKIHLSSDSRNQALGQAYISRFGMDLVQGDRKKAKADLKQGEKYLDKGHALPPERKKFIEEQIGAMLKARSPRD